MLFVIVFVPLTGWCLARSYNKLLYIHLCNQSSLSGLSNTIIWSESEPKTSRHPLVNF